MIKHKLVRAGDGAARNHYGKIIIHANTTSRQEKFGSGLDINIFLHNSSVSTCAFRKR